jgi:hypothetical protein
MTLRFGTPFHLKRSQAIEYFVKEKMEELKLGQMKEFVHFGLTSQDINNTAIPLSFKEALETQYFPALSSVVEKMRKVTCIRLKIHWKTVGQRVDGNSNVSKNSRSTCNSYKIGKRIYGLGRKNR